MEWAYGITTVPSRLETFLPATMESLAVAGFDDPILFVDGAGDTTHLPQYSGLVIRCPKVGHLGNWYSSLISLYVTHPKADRYALFEDDLLACSNLREYLDRCPYPPEGYWNLLTHDVNLHLTKGRRGWHASNQKGKGAVGLVFSGDVLRKLMKTPGFVERPWNDKRKCADGMVIDCLKPEGVTEYIHYPSLLQHVGLESTMPGHKYGTVKGFMGTNYNPLELLDKPQQEFKMTEDKALAMMVAPGDKRPSVWRGGVIQIHVTRACDLACFGCTQGSNLGGKPVMISVEDFEVACESLQGYWGVVGMFGGNPALHPKFEQLCEILRSHFPKEQCGLWCNNPRGKAATMRDTFNPRYSNLNVHCNQAAYDEFKLHWPECKPFGLEDSSHSPPYVAMKDVIADEGKRWELISTCDINQNWSAMVCHVPGKGLRGFFCEIAGAQAMLHCNDPSWPDTGLHVNGGYLPTGEDSTYMGPVVQWWQLGMEDYRDQVRQHCHACGIPLRRKGQLAVQGTTEEVSATHASIYKTKVVGRSVELVQIDQGPKVRQVTDYVGNAAR